jgi:hypothetical protein
MDIRAVGQHLLTDTQRLGRMISLGVKVTAVFASMHWTLVEFARPLGGHVRSSRRYVAERRAVTGSSADADGRRRAGSA